MLLRAFTKREKVLLVILAVVMLAGFYVLSVQNPVHTRLQELEAQLENVELEAEIAQLQADRYQAMQQELESLFAQPKSEITVMPPYDNLQPLMNQLNLIFAPATSFDLNFQPIVIEDSVARRAIGMDFTCADYTVARGIIEQLSYTGWRCLVSELTLSAARQDSDVASGSVSVTATITYFEQVP
jgi:hypothetical protein